MPRYFLSPVYCFGAIFLFAPCSSNVYLRSTFSRPFVAGMVDVERHDTTDVHGYRRVDGREGSSCQQDEAGFYPLGSCSKQPKHEKSSDMARHGVPADWKFKLPVGDSGAGRKMFIEAECYKCHEIKGESFPGVAEADKGVGPELSQMAGMHPVEFFAESIINPNAVIDPEDKKLGYLGDDGNSKMPDYSDVLTVRQVSDLAAYLASLKGPGHKTH